MDKYVDNVTYLVMELVGHDTVDVFAAGVVVALVVVAVERTALVVVEIVLVVAEGLLASRVVGLDQREHLIGVDCLEIDLSRVNAPELLSLLMLLLWAGWRNELGGQG